MIYGNWLISIHYPLWIYQDVEKVTLLTLLIPQSMKTSLMNGTSSLTRIEVAHSSFLLWNEASFLGFIIFWVFRKVHHMDDISSEITATIWSSWRAAVVVRSTEETTRKNNTKYKEAASSFQRVIFIIKWLNSEKLMRIFVMNKKTWITSHHSLVA